LVLEVLEVRPGAGVLVLQVQGGALQHPKHPAPEALPAPAPLAPARTSGTFSTYN
jgi:hypothetical protein